MSKIIKTLTIIVIICLAGAGGFYFTAQAKENTKKYDPKAKPVKTIIVSKSNHIKTRSFPGKVRASKRVDLSFEVSGVLTDLPIREGMRVKKDQLIAKLDQRTFKNNVLSAEADFTEAKLNYERKTKLHKDKIIPQSELDTAKSTFDRTKAALEIARKNLSDTELTAPFDGIIASKDVENHQRITATEQIVSLQDITNIEIAIQIPESIMVYAAPNDFHDTVTVKFDAIPDKEFEATVHEFSIDADSQTQTYELVVMMPTSKKYNFLPGMTASVTSKVFIRPTEELLNTIWLPATAVQGEEKGNKTYVYIVTPDNIVEKRYIEIGSPTKSGIPVTSGLKEGEKVIIAGSSYLQNGMKVRPL